MTHWQDDRYGIAEISLVTLLLAALLALPLRALLWLRARML